MVENVPFQSRQKDIATWQLGPISSLALTCETKPKSAPAVPILPERRIDAPAIVRTVGNDMRVVRDGAYINKTSWVIRHDSTLNWSLVLPDDCQLLSCSVSGKQVAPALQDAHTIVLALPAPKDTDETRVELAYTGRRPPFDPVRGELFLALPSTSLLVESLNWQLSIPRPYDIVAVQGNVDYAPATGPGEIVLTRELGRGDAPNVHVFYQKPETTTKNDR